jgi:BlaI family penicillinase repressor
MPRRTVELTEAEWAIIKVVWEKEPCSAPAVQAELKSRTSWSYSTVRTMLDRMTAKGILSACKSGKVTLFRSTITRKQAQRSELLYTLKNAFNGALTPMVQGLLDAGSLSQEEIAEIESLIASKKKSGKK